MTASGDDRFSRPKNMRCKCSSQSRSHQNSCSDARAPLWAEYQGLAVFKKCLDCHALKLFRRYFAVSNLWDHFVNPKSGNSYTETKTEYHWEKTKVFDQRKVVFLNGIIVYTYQKTAYFTFCSSMSLLRTKMSTQICFICIKEYAVFFSSLRNGGK